MSKKSKGPCAKTKKQDVDVGDHRHLDDPFYRVVHIDLLMRDFILPHLDWVDVYSLSRTIDAIFLAKGYWLWLIKQSLADRKRLKIITTFGKTVEERVKESNDPKFFHDVGLRLGSALRDWREQFSRDAISGKLYNLRRDTFVDESSSTSGAIEAGEENPGSLLSQEGEEDESQHPRWQFTIDESCAFVIGHKLVRAHHYKSGGQPNGSQGQPTVFVWKVDNGGNVDVYNSFSLDPQWARTWIRHSTAPQWFFSVGDHVMGIYQTTDHVRFMPVWNWRRGLQVTAYVDKNGGEFEEFFRFSKLCAKNGYIVTGNGLSLRVWETKDDWKSAEKKFPPIQTHCMQLDFNEEFIVTVGTCRRGFTRKNSLVLRVWSMENGKKIRQFDTSHQFFILFDQKLIFAAYERDGETGGYSEAVRWSYVDLADEATGGDIVTAGDSAPLPARRVILSEFDGYASKQVRQVSVPFSVSQSGIAEKFLTSFTPGSYESTEFCSVDMPGLNLWDAGTLFRVRTEKADGAIDGDDAVANEKPLCRPCRIDLKKLSKYLSKSKRFEALPNIHDISVDCYNIIICYDDALEIIPLLDR